jgi:cell division protein ZapB
MLCGVRAARAQRAAHSTVQFGERDDCTRLRERVAKRVVVERRDGRFARHVKAARVPLGMLSPASSLLTVTDAGSILSRMTTEQTNHRFDLELRRLEKRLEELVVLCRQPQEENTSLRHRQDMLTSERASLLHKNEQVRGRVEAMIGRLKGMEQAS